MGADSSTLQSIESLNSTLEDIEQKLFVIEDVHLHHERTISLDDAVIISGKKIACRAGASLRVGPVLGAVGCDFARVLVETDVTADLTLNVFATDEGLVCTRFVSTQALRAAGGVPVAARVVGLLPDTRYTLHIGGVTPAQTVSLSAVFRTLPLEARRVRALLAHNGRVDRLLPGETDLWREIEQRVTGPEGPGSSFGSGSGSGLGSGSRSGSGAHDSSPTSTPPTPTPVHLLVHVGNLVSVEPLLRARAVQLLELLTREDASWGEWEALLGDLEERLREAYRNALSAPALQLTLRRCGNVFLAGPEEAGVNTASLLAAPLPAFLSPGGGEARMADQKQAREKERQRESESESPLEKVQRQAREKKGVPVEPLEPVELTVDRARQHVVPAATAASSAAAGLAASDKLRESKKEDKDGDVDGDRDVEAAPPKDSYMISDDQDTAKDESAPLFGGALRRFFEAEAQSVQSRQLQQDNLRRLLAGLLLRSVRRVSWAYLRQLWDGDYAALAEADEDREGHFRAMLRLQKVLQVKTSLRAALESSRLRLAQQLGPQEEKGGAGEQLAGRCGLLKEQIGTLEMELRRAAVGSGEAAVRAQALNAPNGACMQLGPLCLLLVEGSWGWLGADDQLLFPVVREGEIHEQIQLRLEQILVPAPPHSEDDPPSPLPSQATAEQPGARGAGEGAERGERGEEGKEGEGKEGEGTKEVAVASRAVKFAPPPAVQAVLCVSTSPLLPCPPQLRNTDGTGEKAGAGAEAGEGGVPGLRALSQPSQHLQELFKVSSLDARRVLQLLSRWQQESPLRAVLLACPAPPGVLSMQGQATPYAVDSLGREISQEALELPQNVSADVWLGRCALQQVLVGDMSRRGTPSLRYFRDLALLRAASGEGDGEEGGDLVAVKDEACQFRSRFLRSSQCLRRCFWDVSFCPQVPPSKVGGAGGRMREGPAACFLTQCVSDVGGTGGGSAGVVALGPVVGWLDCSSACVLLQLCWGGAVELLALDQLTGAEFVCVRVASAGRPCLFRFEGLMPNRAYDLLLLADHQMGSGGGSGGGVVGSHYLPRPALWGSFTTAPSMHSPLERRLVGGGSQSSRGEGEGEGGVATDAATVRALRLATSPGTEAEVIEEERGRGVLRLLLLGADRPTLRGVVAPAASTLTTSTAPLPSSSSVPPDAAEAWALLGGERAQLQGGLALAAAVGEVLGRGWGGVDLVLHTASCVDWGTTADVCLSLLSEAEALTRRLATPPALQALGPLALTHSAPTPAALAGAAVAGGGAVTAASYGLGPGAGGAEAGPSAGAWSQAAGAGQASIRALLLRAGEQLRRAYLLHWSTPHARLLAHGCHHFASCAAAELLTLFHSSSMRELGRDLSPYCARQLLRMIEGLHSEYQRPLGLSAGAGEEGEGKGMGTGMGAGMGMGAGSGREEALLRLLDGGATALFELRPDLICDAAGGGGGGGGAEAGAVIPLHQLASLRRLLFPPLYAAGLSVPYAPSVSSVNELQTLVLLSPLPLVLHDTAYAELSLGGGVQRVMGGYPIRESLRLLDLLADWLQGGGGREVVVVAGGGCCFSTTVLVETLDAGGGDVGGGGGDVGGGGAGASGGDGDASGGGAGGGGVDSPVPPPSPLSTKGSFSFPHVRRNSFLSHAQAQTEADRGRGRGGGGGMWGQRAQGTQGGQGQGAQGASPAPIPVPVLRIRQVCCGPLLGLHEDALPRRQGSLFSAGGGLGGGRRYWFTHEAAAAEQVGQGQGVGQGTSLCALLEIPLSSHRAAIRADREARERDRERVQPMHRTPSTLQREGIPEHPGDSGDAGMGGIDEEVVEGGEGDEAAVRFVDAAGLRLLADRHWPAPAHAHTHSHRHQGLGHGHGVGVGRSRLQDQPQLLSLSRQLRAILRAQDAQVQQGQAQGQVQVQQKRQQGQQGQGQAQGQQQGQQGASPILPGGPHVSELLRAVSALCLREEEVFRQAHQMYQSHQHFPLPLPLPSDGSASTSSSSASLSSQRCLQALLLWVLGSVGPQARTLLRAPSSAVLALVWAHHVQREGGQGQREGGQGGELLVAASMDADEIYFCSLLRACLGLQLVAEYLAYAQGLLDG